MALGRRKLGETGLRVSELGFGCSSFWAKSAFPEARAFELVHKAIERGVNFFDTGSNYAGGQAERRLGKVLREHRDKDLVIATKAGTWAADDGSEYRDFSPTAVRKGVEGSLKRLDLDHVSLLHLHAPPAGAITDELLRCLEKLKQDGLVSFCGVNGENKRIIETVLEHDVFSTVMFDYNVFQSAKKPVLAKLAAAGVGFIAATPLGQAHWSNKLFKPTRVADLWYIARALRRHRAKVVRGFSFRFIENYPGWTGGEVAIAYALSNPDVSAAIFGTTSVDRLAENLGASGRELPQEIIDRIEAS